MSLIGSKKLIISELCKSGPEFYSPFLNGIQNTLKSRLRVCLNKL
jgi:hypothetical protein